MALQKNGSANRSLLRPSLFIYNVYKVQNSINHMLNPSADRDVNNVYQLSTEKARQWWRNQAFESRKDIVIESEAVINDDKLVEDQTVADIADKDYDDLPDVTKQEVELQVEDSETIEELFEVKDDEYLKCSTCEEVFTSNEDYESHKSVDHGEEPEDLEDSFEAYQLTMHPELTKESLRKANNLLTETEERQLYSGYDKNGDVQSSIMPYNLPPVATGKYDDNPNEFFYSNKIFRAGSSTERTSSLGESKAKANEWELPAELQGLIPNSGSVSDPDLEELRKAMNTYYEVSNNGGGNWYDGADGDTKSLMQNYNLSNTERLEAFHVDHNENPYDDDGYDIEIDTDEEDRLMRSSMSELETIINQLIEKAKGKRNSNNWNSWESRANEDDEYEYGFIPKVSGFGEDKDNDLPIKDHTHNFTSGYKHSNGIDYILQCSDSGCGATKNQDLYMESKASEGRTMEQVWNQASPSQREGIMIEGGIEYEETGQSYFGDDGNDSDSLLHNLDDSGTDSGRWSAQNKSAMDSLSNTSYDNLPVNIRDRVDSGIISYGLNLEGESKASENWEDMELDGSEWSFTDSNEDVISCNKCGKTFNVGSYPRSSRAGYDVMEWDAQTHGRLHEPNPEGGRGWTHPDNKRDPYNFYNDGTPVLRNESKAGEKGEWDWLDKGADSKSVDYDEVEYKDDGVSDISIQKTEPKLKDQNAFLDNVNIGLESVDFVYKTKASEAMEKTYIPVSETLEGDYEEFEDSDEEMIKETITLRKLTGYGDDAIARELHINYGVSHEEALEKVYSVEVSTNDRVSQTFFGKMYKECTESEKDELQMYSGSD